MSIVVERVTDSFKAFSETARQFMPIRTEDDYNEALSVMEHLMLTLDDSGEDPLVNLLEMIARSVEDYEDQKPEIQLFIEKVDSIPAEVAVLRVLMDQYKLTMDDFHEEIGKKSYVSMIMRQERELSKKHIGNLCKRFHISPELFYMH